MTKLGQIKQYYDDELSDLKCPTARQEIKDIDWLIARCERLETALQDKDQLIADVRSEMTQIHGLTDPEWCRTTLTEALAITPENVGDENES